MIAHECLDMMNLTKINILFTDNIHFWIVNFLICERSSNNGYFKRYFRYAEGLKLEQAYL